MRSQGSRKMIFSSLFTPKWKSKKASDRLLAISQLDANKVKDNTILNQLANNDDDDKVKIAALKRINDISLWWQTYKQENSQPVVSAAEKEIFNQLEQKKPTNDELELLVKRCDKTQQLEALLPLVNDFNVQVSLLKRIGKKPLITDFFAHASDSQQLELVPVMQQYQLDKALLKHAKPALAEQLKQQEETRKREALKPIEVNKASTLVLAKLNALRDKFDFVKCDTEYKQLEAQWQQLELDYLDDKQSVVAKYQDITAKAQKHLVGLKAKFDEEQAAKLRQDKIKSVKQTSVSLKECGENALDALLLEPTADNVSALETSLSAMNAHQAELDSLSQSDSDFTKFTQRLTAQCAEIKDVIESLPAIAEQVNLGKALIVASDLQGLDEAQEAKSQWYSTTSDMLKQLPKPLLQNYQKQMREMDKHWKASHQDLLKEVKSLQQDVTKQLKDIKRLIDAGRYKVCFGIFKGVQENIEKLPKSSQQKLEAEYQLVDQELTKVNEWQREISLPKRHELIEEVKQKIAQNDVDIAELSQWIKVARKRWNELGYIATDEEKTLDETFNQQLEIAFTPCREHYAALEAAREQNVVTRKNLIVQYQALADSVSTLTLKEVEKQYKQLKQNWRNAGEVDNKNYKQLLAELKPIDNQIFAFIKAAYAVNADTKAKLVKEAEACLTDDNIENVIEQLKSLQQRWKDIGFAGKKLENQLWNEFRAVNDRAFSLRDSERQAKREQQDEKLVSLQSEFTRITQDVELDNVDSLTNAISALANLRDELKQAYLLKSQLSNEVSSTLTEYAAKQEVLKNSKDKEKLISLFEQLEQGIVPPSWQQKVPSELTRQQITIRIELLNEMGSPESDDAVRLSEQVTLLQEKVNGAALDNETLLKQWLSKGEIDSESLALLARIKPAFV